jgi:FSR family fosmidomycin resistance protein-like MFS transporter
MAKRIQPTQPVKTLSGEFKILGLIGTGHFMSHFYSLTLPLIITFLAADYGLSPTQLGFFIAGFTSAAAVAQMPIGILVDRIGARNILVGGLLLEATAIGALAFVDGYPLLVMFAVLVVSV